MLHNDTNFNENNYYINDYRYLHINLNKKLTYEVISLREITERITHSTWPHYKHLCYHTIHWKVVENLEE